MRIRAQGLHKRPVRITTRSCVTMLAATLAALFAVLSLTGTFASASTGIPVAAMADRAAESPAYVMSDSQLKFELARIATQTRIRAAARAAAVLAAHTYTVRSGDSLSSVAAKRCGQARMWTGIYAASRAHRWTGKNANNLAAGQHLYLSCAYMPSMLKFAPAPPPPPPPPVVRTVTSGTYRGSAGTSSPRSNVSGTYHGSGSMQQCIISRESGGNAGIWNASGHWGLYQFSASTWAAHGGSPSSFGNASVAEQNRVYYQTVADSHGYGDWAPYDGC